MISVVILFIEWVVDQGSALRVCFPRFDTNRQLRIVRTLELYNLPCEL